MQTLSRVPFGTDWARAAAHVAHVETFRFGPATAAGPRAATPDDAGEPHLIQAAKLRPDRILARLSDRLSAAAVVRQVHDLQCRTGPIDVIHAHFYSGARCLPEACARLGIPLVVTEHSTRLTGRSAAHKPFTSANRRTAARVYAASARVIAVSDHLRSCIEGAGLAQGVVTIPNPVDVPATDRSEDAIRPEIVSVGRLEADKDPLLLLDAFALVRRTRPDLRLVMIGAGPLRAEVDDRCARTDVAGHVEVLGRVPRSVVLERLATARCFALASTVETFCMAAAEAVLSGVPVVMPRLAPVVDVVGSLGELVETPDADTFAAAILRTCAAPCDSWPEADRQVRREWLAPASVGRRLEAVYAEVLGRA